MILLSDFYESVFGCKAYKIALDAGCTCPNRDGTKGTGGCIFCGGNGSGDFVPSRSLPVRAQVEEARTRISAKLCGRSGKRRGKLVAYFQNFSSTYGNPDALEETFIEALGCDDVVGLAVATRPDCLGDDILSRLARMSEDTFVQIELGLQTSNERTGRLINRCYTDDDFSDAVLRIKRAAPKIHVVAHVIFGLPGEGEKDMMGTVDFVSGSGADGIKLTELYVIRGTGICAMYEGRKFEVLSKDEYFRLLSLALRRLPETMVVHRLTGDPPRKSLVAPLWASDKKRIMGESMAIAVKIMDETFKFP
ncbi:MAG: TIGR01212 family radical SAM protein [Treponema sp.]|uniref:TIGR01212 family radical SAM protein n=1 Tax=Treponema sp. TaxID=166 RepID=UPI00257C7EF7|nr:TIGR01212 family radical SAM protein [Treponema sp.]MBQ5536975.1 TIGR01212 family radical SAM protein [Treponema sp.]